MSSLCRRPGRSVPASALARHTGALAVILVGTLATATPALAQSMTTGAIEGVTLSSDGRRLADVGVTLTHRATNLQRSVTSDAVGAFHSVALPPGRYDLRAERLGYRPLVMQDVIVGPATSVTLDLRLTAAEPPVTQIDTVQFSEGAVPASLAQGTWDRGRDLVDLVDPQGRVSSLAEVAAVADAGLGIAGFPDRLAATGVDGIPHAVASHPGVSRTDLSALAVPFVALDHAEIVPGSDVEWPGYGGGLISAFSSRAPRLAQLRAYGDMVGNGVRGALVVGGPLVRDTASALVGVDFRRIETGFAAPWRSDSAAAVAAGVAQDSLGQDLSAYLRPATQRTDIVTAFGRFDWEPAAGQTVALRAAFADRSTSNLDLGPGRFLGLGTSLDARDISVSVALESRLSARLQSRIAISVDRSERDYRAPALPGTMLVADARFAGAEGALPGQFERNTARVLAAIQYSRGGHALKLGAVTAWTNHDLTYDPWRSGMYLFGSTGDFAVRRGYFVQSVGGVPSATFTTTSTAGFLQDTWTPVRGLRVLAGLRLDAARWPTGGVDLDTTWARRTLLLNAVVPKLKTRLDPRFAFTWSAGPRREWLLRGEAGMYAEAMDPSVLAEVLTHDGTAKMRRGLGVLGGWPEVPDSVAAPVTGRVLTLLQPGFAAPRTSRVGLSIARSFGGASLALNGQYRHTDRLPRRADLNLAASAGLADQDGRPIYGALRQYGAMLAAVPGSDRRFTDYDRVWALDPSGYSDYWGLTVSLESVREEGLSFWAAYTYSGTTDNWPGGAGTVPELQLSPFRDRTGQADWRDGRSDLDVPHRGSLGVEWAVGAVSVSGLLRVRSGLPFTPGFQDGVDANGDGSWGNDPAFVSDTVSGTDALIAGNACLRKQIGRFAERNSCRAPMVASVDARLSVRLFNVLGAPVAAVVDGLNLVTTDDGVVDRALYLVDPSRSLTTTGGVVQVPLVANPGFGKLLVRRSPGVAVRAGLTVNF